MASTLLEDPALAAKPQPFDVLPSSAASALTAASPVAIDPAVAVPQIKAASPEAAATAFPHYADDLPTRKVKTQTINPDATPMNAALAKASDLSKAELPTAQTTAGNLINEAGRDGVTNLNQLAYIMATTRRESHMGNWMNEFGGTSYFEQHYGSNTKKGKELGNTERHDGADFHGRGLVQITGRTNYTKWNNRLGKEGVEHDGQPIDMVNNPEQAASPGIATKIAVEGMRDAGFTKYKLDDFINDKQTDYLHARKIINGMNEAPEIAAQATKFQGVLENYSGDYTNAMIGAQTKNLPSAHDATGLTAPSLSAAMVDPTRMTSGAAKFDKPHKLLNNSLGHFGPSPATTGKITNLHTHVVP